MGSRDIEHLGEPLNQSSCVYQVYCKMNAWANLESHAQTELSYGLLHVTKQVFFVPSGLRCKFCTISADRL